MKLDKKNWNSYILKFPDLELNLGEIYLNLGYHGQLPENYFVDLINQMIENIGNFCQPQAGYFIAEGKMSDNNYLIINNISIKVGAVITKHLNTSSHFAIFVATAGNEFDLYLEQLKAEGDIVTEFLAYSIGSEIAEATVRHISNIISVEANEKGFKTSNSYSPGYCSWQVREQDQLFSLLPESPCGIKLNQSSLMYPIKSVSGIIGIGENVERTTQACKICGMITCYKRKATK